MKKLHIFPLPCSRVWECVSRVEFQPGAVIVPPDFTKWWMRETSLVLRCPFCHAFFLIQLFWCEFYALCHHLLTWTRVHYFCRLSFFLKKIITVYIRLRNEMRLRICQRDPGFSLGWRWAPWGQFLPTGAGVPGRKIPSHMCGIAVLIITEKFPAGSREVLWCLQPVALWLSALSLLEVREEKAEVWPPAGKMKLDVIYPCSKLNFGSNAVIPC